MKKLLSTGVMGLVVVMRDPSLSDISLQTAYRPDETNDDPSLANSRGLAADQSLSQSERLPQAAISRVSTLADIESVASFFQRTLAIHELVGNADEETLLQHWEETTRLPPGLREEVQIVVVQRLATLDPKAAWDIVSDYRSVEQPALVTATFREWSVKNLNEAIEYARTLDLETRNTAVASMVLSREDLSAEQRRELARQLNSEWLAIEAIKRTTDTYQSRTPNLSGQHSCSTTVEILTVQTTPSFE